MNAPKGPRQPSSASALLVDVGGLCVRLRSDHSQWLQTARQRYADFLIDDESPGGAESAGTVDITYAVRENGLLSPKQLFDGRMTGLTSQRRGKALSIAGARFSAELDVASRHLRIAGPLAVYPLDLLLPMLWYELHAHGLILHGAALADQQYGYLLSGPSGSGKSTLAGLFPESALCDEFSAVSFQNRLTTLHGMPFWVGRPGCAPLSAIYLLQHGGTNSRCAVTTASAYRALQREICWPLYDHERAERAFQDLATLVESVPVWRLSFRPDRDVWATLAEDAA